ncbi:MULTISPECIES: enoyl-CoA hydratase-related protein [Bordetella]|uniref:Enoyl-CoA hydratase n=2 Tax=Bordetella TaxID=517 RepID=A0A261V5Q3_9BORD|nr:MULTISPECIES: enoyl-CoA hydratase-related protein [Bordetella]MDM9560963.1 enoyl-CoA hydratase-related protein [Bordetella petrii]OZI69456.1 enoyl-CoA hydratase [Bordetella genomosp. 2]
MDGPARDNDLVLLDRPDQGVARLTLNRPAARNALNSALRQALRQAFEALEQDASVRCVVLRGSHGCFAAGADLKEIAGLDAGAVARLPVLETWRVIAGFSKPLIAAVAGPALGGGCELAQHADIILAARSARFGQPEVNVGIMPGGGATQRLVRALGYWRAMRLMLAGEPISAEEALAIGLASEVVDDERLDARALELARLIASRPPIAVRQIKRVALAGADASLATGLQLERQAFELLFDTQDQKEGMRAFAERRPPVFAGR